MSPDLRLALGSNIGDREGHLADARELIAAILMQEMDASPVASDRRSHRTAYRVPAAGGRPDRARLRFWHDPLRISD